MTQLMKRRMALVALVTAASFGCGRSTPQSQDVAPGAAPPPTADSGAATKAVTDYPRPGMPAKQYRIGVAIPHLSNPHYVGQAYGYIDEAQHLGAQITLLEAGGYQYLDRQVSQIEDLVASKVDAIIVAAVSGPGTVGAIEGAAAAGIPVINVNVMTDSDKVNMERHSARPPPKPALPERRAETVLPLRSTGRGSSALAHCV